MGDNCEIEIYAGDERIVIKKEVLEQIILHSIIGGAIASCELEGDMLTETEKDILFHHHPADGALDQLLKTK